jgi:hypothetical protein
MLITCPHCQASIDYDFAFDGKQFCPHCKRLVFRLPRFARLIAALNLFWGCLVCILMLIAWCFLFQYLFGGGCTDVTHAIGRSLRRLLE